MRRLFAVLLVAWVTPLWAQSLVEVAAREKKRREAQAKATSGKPAQSFTDDDLKGRSPEASTDRPSDATAPPTTEPDSYSSRPRSRSYDDQGKKRMAENIKSRLLSCRDDVEEGERFLKALETRMANLQPSPYYGTEAAKQEMEQLIKQGREVIAAAKKRCDDIEDEARTAGIPAGWIR